MRLVDLNLTEAFLLGCVVRAASAMVSLEVLYCAISLVLPFGNHQLLFEGSHSLCGFFVIKALLALSRRETTSAFARQMEWIDGHLKVTAVASLAHLYQGIICVFKPFEVPASVQHPSCHRNEQNRPSRGANHDARTIVTIPVRAGGLTRPVVLRSVVVASHSNHPVRARGTRHALEHWTHRRVVRGGVVVWGAPRSAICRARQSVRVEAIGARIVLVVRALEAD